MDEVWILPPLNLNILEVLLDEQLTPTKILANFSDDPLIHFVFSDGPLVEHVQKAANLSNLIVGTVFEDQGIRLKVKVIDIVFPLLDELPIEDLLLKLVVECVRKFDHNVASLWEDEDVARRLKRAEEEEVDQNLIQKGHIVDEVDLEAEDTLFFWVEV